MGSSRQYILLVDDDPKVLAALDLELQSWAKRRSLEILQATSAMEGLKLVDEYGDDIYISIAELRMSDMLGSDFIAELSLTHPHIVTFLLSGVPDIDEIIKSLHANMFSLIGKPWDTWNLRLELSMAFEVAENRRIGLRSALMGKTSHAPAARNQPVLVHEPG